MQAERASAAAKILPNLYFRGLSDINGLQRFFWIRDARRLPLFSCLFRLSAALASPS
jgi:hypothetical protein